MRKKTRIAIVNEYSLVECMDRIILMQNRDHSNLAPSSEMFLTSLLFCFLRCVYLTPAPDSMHSCRERILAQFRTVADIGTLEQLKRTHDLDLEVFTKVKDEVVEDENVKVWKHWMMFYQYD